MLTNPSNEAEFPVSTPPTRPAMAIAPAARSGWPTVVGVLAVVFGALAILGGLWGCVSPWLFRWIEGIAPTNATLGLKGFYESRFMIVSMSLVMAAVAALLLVAGLGLLKRRAWAPKASWCWAIAKVIFVPAQMIVQYQLQKQQFDVLIGHSPRPAAMSGDFIFVFQAIGMALGLIWGWAFPVFLMIWLSRKKIKNEISTWS